MPGPISATLAVFLGLFLALGPFSPALGEVVDAGPENGAALGDQGEPGEQGEQTDQGEQVPASTLAGEAVDGASPGQTANVAAPVSIDWKEADKGLEYAEVAVDGFTLAVVRVDPDENEFVLCSAGSEDGTARTLREWGERHDLLAAINASMYLPDGSTSTGYMRSGDYVNNGRYVQRFGAFFAAQPDDPDLPSAAIFEREDDLWADMLPHYRVVVQNYRLVNSQRRILWSPGGPLYSISAVAQDGEGNILLLHSQEPIEAYSFAQKLLHLPLDIRTVMYVEGGGQAGLLLRAKNLEREHVGKSAMDWFVTGNRTVKLPNVIGVRKARAGDEAKPGLAKPVPMPEEKSAEQPQDGSLGQSPDERPR